MEPRLNGIWPQTGLRPSSKLDSVMEFGFKQAVTQHSRRRQIQASLLSYYQHRAVLAVPQPAMNSRFTGFILSTSTGRECWRQVNERVASVKYERNSVRFMGTTRLTADCEGRLTRSLECRSRQRLTCWSRGSGVPHADVLLRPQQLMTV